MRGHLRHREVEGWEELFIRRDYPEQRPVCTLWAQLRTSWGFTFKDILIVTPVLWLLDQWWAGILPSHGLGNKLKEAT